MKESSSTFSFGVMDLNINGLNIGGLVLAAKFGDKRAKFLHRALHNLIGEVARIWDEKWGEGDFVDFCESVQTIE